MAYDMQHEVEKVLGTFSAELMKIFRQAIVSSLGGGLSAAPSLPSGGESTGAKRGRKPKAVAAPAAAPSKRGGRRGPKSSPEEVDELGEKILDLIRKSGSTMASADMRKKLHVPEGQFTYALNKLKDDGRVDQVGERRMARYGLGSSKTKKPAAPRKKPGRKPKAVEAPAAENPASAE